MRLLLDLTPRRATFGLAVDEALLESARDGGEAVRLWVSRRAVIVGRSQSAASECDREALRRLRIPVLRRVSGGGAVVHYPGNLNVSITLADGWLGSAERAFVWFGAAVASGLRSLGADAQAGDRRIHIAGRKISGLAQARRGDAVLVHGTLLVRPDAVDMASLLRAMQEGYAPVATRSHPSAVTSLSEVLGRSVALGEAADAVLRGLGERLPRPWGAGTMTPAEEAQTALLEKTRYRSRTWNESR